MRKTNVTVRNNQTLEVFTQGRGEGFEIWTVGLVKERRTVLSHHLTHDDLEARLCYARPGDLTWKNATRSEIPVEKHLSAVQEEESIKRGTFVDNAKEQQRSVTWHLGVNNLLSLDRKVCNAAKKAILGTWTDGIASVGFEPQSKLTWSCPMAQPHLLNSGVRVHKRIPDWWSFASWELYLMNAMHKCGMHLGVLHVDDRELHLFSDQPDRLAHVFRRRPSAVG